MLVTRAILNQDPSYIDLEDVLNTVRSVEQKSRAHRKACSAFKDAAHNWFTASTKYKDMLRSSTYDFVDRFFRAKSMYFRTSMCIAVAVLYDLKVFVWRSNRIDRNIFDYTDCYGTGSQTIHVVWNNQLQGGHFDRLIPVPQSNTIGSSTNNSAATAQISAETPPSPIASSAALDAMEIDGLRTPTYDSACVVDADALSATDTLVAAAAEALEGLRQSNKKRSTPSTFASPAASSKRRKSMNGEPQLVKSPKTPSKQKSLTAEFDDSANNSTPKRRLKAKRGHVRRLRFTSPKIAKRSRQHHNIMKQKHHDAATVKIWKAFGQQKRNSGQWRTTLTTFMKSMVDILQHEAGMDPEALFTAFYGTQFAKKNELRPKVEGATKLVIENLRLKCQSERTYEQRRWVSFIRNVGYSRKEIANLFGWAIGKKCMFRLFTWLVALFNFYSYILPLNISVGFS